LRLVLDTGALLAVERGDRDTMALLKRELLARRVPLTHGGVVAQAWRGAAGKQANLARLLNAVQVVALDDRLGRLAGALRGRARKADAIDAAVALLAADGDVILTSDPNDLRPLAASAALHVDLVRV
jgi:predicted nucleic acid-binding protein